MLKGKTPNLKNAPMTFVESYVPRTLHCLIALSLSIVFVYIHTLNVPFYLDDYPSIRDNFAIRDLSNFDAIYGFASQRVIGYLSFALNYFFHGYSLPGYHLVNIAIHLCASITVFFIVRKITVLMDSQKQLSLSVINMLPILAALLFALHPLQTQAVTYIVQRLATMAALFYLLGFLSYLNFRTVLGRFEKLAWLGLLVISAIAGIMTKQNAVTLPVVLLLAEICFFGLWGRKLFFGLSAAFFLVAAPIAYYYFLIDDGFFDELAAATTETSLVSRSEYLAIQMGVIWSYLFKSLLPIGLQLDIDTQVSNFSDPWVWLFTAGHTALLAVGFFCFKNHRIISFGLFFYYIALSIESSIIPIRDFAFEHRTYLPNFGLSLLLAYVILNFIPLMLGFKRTVIFIVGILICLSALTWQRNNTWRDPAAFFAHEIALSPGVLRPYGMLGEYYLRIGDGENAAKAYFEGMSIIDSSFDRQNNTQIAFIQNSILALDLADRDEEALALLNDLSWGGTRDRDQSKFFSLRGNIYAQRQEILQAQSDFEQALVLDRRNLDAKLSYGKVLYMQARMDESKQQFLELIEIDQNHPLVSEARTLLEAISNYESQLQ